MVSSDRHTRRLCGCKSCDPWTSRGVVEEIVFSTGPRLIGAHPSCWLRTLGGMHHTYLRIFFGMMGVGVFLLLWSFSIYAVLVKSPLHNFIIHEILTKILTFHSIFVCLPNISAFAMSENGSVWMTKVGRLPVAR